MVALDEAIAAGAVAISEVEAACLAGELSVPFERVGLFPLDDLWVAFTRAVETRDKRAFGRFGDLGFVGAREIRPQVLVGVDARKRRADRSSRGRQRSAILCVGIPDLDVGLRASAQPATCLAPAPGSRRRRSMSFM